MQIASYFFIFLLGYIIGVDSELTPLDILNIIYNQVRVSMWQ